MTIGNIWLGSMQYEEVAVSQNLSAAAFSMASVIHSTPSVVDYVTVHIPAACTETLQIAIVPAAGTAYSTVLFAASTSGYTSFFYQSDRPIFLYQGAQVIVTVSNGDTTGTIDGVMGVLY